ncbi:MAG: SDR family oxidoreductase [Rhizorhabdus sp.]
MSFTGKVAVITGAGAGFGAAFAAALASRGTQVALLDIDVPAAQNVAAEIGVQAIALKCDVASTASVESAVARVIERFGGVDILINNAGLHSAEFNKGFAELGPEASRRLFDVNVHGVVNASVACRSSMAARGGGAIVNISSIAAWACTSAYGVSKLAVRGLTLSLAQEFAADRIRVNAIAPGLIATDKIRADFPQSFFDDFANRLQLIHRNGEVDDIVAALLYLCGEEASFITGETLRVSGGYPLSL